MSVNNTPAHSCTHCVAPRSLSSQRIKTCQYCQQHFYYGRSDQQYCKESCRVQACKRRKAQREAIAQRTQLQTNAPTSLASLTAEPTASEPASSSQPSDFWQGVGQSALASAAVSATKYALVEKKMLDKLTRIEQHLHVRALTHTNAHQSPLQFLGLQLLRGKRVAVFEDPRTKRRYSCDEQENWEWFDLRTKHSTKKTSKRKNPQKGRAFQSALKPRKR